MDLPKARTIRKFNPGTLQSDEEVIRQFVVRERELELVLDVLRGNVDAPSCQHVLLVAPRGRGKTMLLARIAAELRTGNDLSQWLLPVRFMEESLEVFDIADFWLETVFYLSKEIVGCDPDLARELHAVHEDLATHWRGEFLADRARAAVLDASIQLGRKFVLMVENLQTLCNDVDDDFGWQLRETLQTEPQIMLVGTATSRFKGLEEAQAPFFELFRTINLHPLDTEACRRLWHMISGDDITERRTRPLQILTGGSPRLLVIVAEFAQHRSLRQLIEELVTLVDEHTEYFRGHLEVLAPAERRVYLAVIDLWKPSGTGEIADRARMDIRSVSSLLGRLIDRGAVVGQGKGRKREYSAAERLYSIYYKMRRERDEASVVFNLIRFMAVFYSDDELTGMSEKLQLDAAQLSSIREGIERAVKELPQFDHVFGNTSSSDTLPSSAEYGTERSPDAKEVHSQIVKSAEEMMAAANEKVLSGDYGASIVIFDNVIDQFTGRKAPRIQESVAAALVLKGTLLEDIGKTSEALSTFTSVEERFHASDVQEIKLLLAEALIKKGAIQRGSRKFNDAISTFESVVERFSNSEEPILKDWATTALGYIGHIYDQNRRFAMAIETYDRILGLTDSIPLPTAQVRAASALYGKGVSQSKLGDLKGAIRTSDYVVSRFADNDIPAIENIVAEMLSLKASLQVELENPQLAIETFDEIFYRYEESTNPKLQISVAEALVAKGVVLGEQGNFEAAVLTFDKVVVRFGTPPDVHFQECVARALCNKGVAQLQVDLDAAIETYNEIVVRFGENREPALRKLVARALFSKGETYFQLGDLESTINSHDEFIAFFDGDDDPDLQIPVATAMNNRGVAQGLLQEFSDAVSSFSLVIERFDSNESPEVQEVVAKSYVNKGSMQAQLGHTAAEILTYDLAIKYVGNSTNPKLQLWSARAMVNKGVAQGRLGDFVASIGNYDQVVSCFSNTKTEELQQVVLTALVNKAIVQGKLGKFSNCISTYDAVVALAGSAEGQWSTEIVAQAQVGKAISQIKINRPEEAQRTCDLIQETLTKLEADKASDIRWQLQWIRIRALLKLNDHSTAFKTFHSVYATADLENELAIQWMIGGVVNIVASGASERDVLDVLLSDKQKSEYLNPLVVALNKRLGLSVRASAEVVDVAEDLIRAMDESNIGS